LKFYFRFVVVSVFSKQREPTTGVSRPSTSDHRSAMKDSEAKTEIARSTFVGLAVSILVSLAIGTHDCQTGHGHRLGPPRGFRWYWTWKVRHGKAGRPCVPKETRELIRTMSRSNVLWGAPRIYGEL
jgi:hypothetical protein